MVGYKDESLLFRDFSLDDFGWKNTEGQNDAPSPKSVNFVGPVVAFEYYYGEVHKWEIEKRGNGHHYNKPRFPEERKKVQ